MGIYPSQNSASASNSDTELKVTSSSGTPEGVSDVARILRRIDLEYEAARQGLTGLAFGTARHDFITARMEQVALCHEQLAAQVGEEEATRLIYDHYVQHHG